MMLEKEVVYFQFSPILDGGHVTIHTDEINRQTWPEYYDGIMNLMKDYIETPYVQNTFVTVDFGNGDVVDLSIPDMYLNIIIWYPIVQLGTKITGEHLSFEKELTKNTIKNFFDQFVIKEYRKTVPSKILNNILDDSVYKYLETDTFALFISNTINLKDTIDLMNANQRFNEIIHVSLKNRPMEEVKDIGMDLTNELIDIIKDSKKYIGYDHCLANSFRSQEGVNPRQFKEFNVNIGSKPNGFGGVFSNIIDGSYITGALNTLEAQFIDSAASRVAQIQTKQNTGDSGNFARLLGLNNIDTELHPDPDHDCGTTQFLHIQVRSKKHLRMMVDMYYRFGPTSLDRIISEEDDFLIGKWIYLRSPITCASAARGNGICHKCMGDLWYTIRNIKPGKYAAELLSSELTQRQLSSKHLLETRIKALDWFENFGKYMVVNMNFIQLNPLVQIEKGTKMIIDLEEINQVNSIDYDKSEYAQSTIDNEYNDYIYSCKIIEHNGTEITIGTKESDRLYLSAELKALIMDSKNNDITRTEENNIIIDLFKLFKENNGQDFTFFLIDINNNELNKTLDDITNLINRKEVVSGQTKESIFNNLMDLVIEGDLHIQAIHLAILIMNQIRDADDILLKPNWSDPNAEVQILTLKDSLINNPSITVTMLFENLGSTLINPLSYKKTAPSRMDLFFMAQPQNFLSNESTLEEEEKPKTKGLKVMTMHKRHNVN